MSKYTRKALKRPDEFLSFWDRVFRAAAPYARAIVIVGTIGCLAVLGGWGADRFFSGRRQRATEQFDRALRIADADLTSTPGSDDAGSGDKTPRFKTEKDRGEAVLAELDKLGKSNRPGGITRRAELLRAGTLYGLGRYTEAQAAFQRYLDATPDSDPLRFLAREGVGLAAEGQGHLDEALAAYRALEPKAGDFYRDRALYDQARVLAKKGDKKGAEAAYKDILSKVPETSLRDEIQSRLALLGARGLQGG